jgi:hypothetical protein
MPQAAPGGSNKLGAARIDATTTDVSLAVGASRGALL